MACENSLKYLKENVEKLCCTNSKALGVKAIFVHTSHHVEFDTRSF